MPTLLLADMTQRLADIQISSVVWFATALILLRLALVRSPAPAARAMTEIVEAALLAAILVFMLIQPFLVKAFYIPSASMVPTLIDNDHILVDKLEYRIIDPHRGDIVVFAAPLKALQAGDEQPAPDGEPTYYIKRLIGLPGDNLQVFGGYVQAGDQIYSHESLINVLGLTDPDERVRLEDNDIRVFDGVKWITFTKQDIAARINSRASQIVINPGYVLRNGLKLSEPYTAEDPNYNMKIVDGHCVTYSPEFDGTVDEDNQPASTAQVQQLMQAPPGRLPAGQVFVMGDNRNDSNDSHYWGTLDEGRIVGRAFLIFYPFPRMRLLH